MGNKRPDLASIRRPVTATDIAELAVDFDAPTAELMPSSASGMAELVQARLRVSEPGDSFENEAESTADAFVRSTHAHSAAHGRAASTGVNRAANDEGLTSDGQGLRTTDEAAANIDAARGGGLQMQPDVRARFENFFGSDLSGVRVHDDARSDGLCRSINAEAFTSGRDVFFTRGAYTPGNAKGDHLLAHELTHVVQQGQGAPVARKASPDIMREEPRLTTKTERDPEASALSTVATTGGGLTSLGSAAAGGFGTLKDVGGTMQVADGKATDVLGLGGKVDATAAVEAGGGLGLFDSVATLFNSTVSLMSNWNAHSFDSAMGEAVNLVKGALSATQNSINIALAAGAGGIAASVVPGLGLAIAVIDLVKQVLRAVDVYKAKSNATKKIDELSAKEDLTPEEEKLKTALTRLRSDTNWEMARTVTRIIGDIVIIGGQIGTIAGGAGAPAVVAGAIINGVAALTGKAQSWMEATAVQDARKAHQADPDNHVLQIERLKVDTYYSACELIKNSAMSVDGSTGSVDASVADFVKPFGIDGAWLDRYNKAGRSEAMLDLGAKLICDKLGKDPDPKTFAQDLMKVVNIMKTGLKWVATAAGYLLKFAGRVLGFVAGQVVGFLGVGAAILQMPSLGRVLVDSIEPVMNATIDATDAAVDSVGEAWDSAAAKIDAKSTGHETYFTTEDDVRLRAVNKFTPIVRTYFAEKKDRGTDVKADSLTAKIKDEYTNLSKIAKNKAPAGKTGFNNASGALNIIDSVIKDIIKACRPDRVDLDSVYVSGGKVSWRYTGDSQKMKTKGLLSGIKNFFGGDKYEKV